MTGVELEQLFADWRTAAYERYGAVAQPRHGDEVSPMLREKSGRLYLAPSLSPNGREAVFFSERDRLSLDLFLADTKTGVIQRKLVTTAGTARFESLQALRSAGSWSPSGDRFVFAAIEHGQPSLIILDIKGKKQERQIALPQFGQVLSPAWSPDGHTLAFSALEGRGHGSLSLRSEQRPAAPAHKRSLRGSAAGMVAGWKADSVRHGSILERPVYAYVRCNRAGPRRGRVRRDQCAAGTDAFEAPEPAVVERRRRASTSSPIPTGSATFIASTSAAGRYIKSRTCPVLFPDWRRRVQRCPSRAVHR